MKSRQCRNGLATAVHEGHRLEQPHRLVSQRDAAKLAMVFGIRAKRAAVLASQGIHQPKAGIVTGLGVFDARITQPNDQLQRWHSWPASLNERERAK